MKVVSEDNRRYSPTAPLYDKIYGKENTRFSMGSGNLKSMVKGLLESGETGDIVVYLDVVPENLHTGRMLLDLYTEFENNDNVYIVPIICSEHCLIMSAKELGYPVDGRIVDILNGNINYKSTEYSDLYSMEKVCKRIKGEYSFLGNGYFSGDLEVKGVEFIVSHRAFLGVDVIRKYYSSSVVDNKTAILNFLELYDKMFSVEGFVEYSQDIRILKSILGV